jgi:uncharacterized protein (DUF1330 family)
MKAYVLLDITVNDPELYERYKAGAGPALAAYGGRFLVRGGAAETVEGDWKPNRVVVLEFDSPEQARAWYGSPEYAEPLKLRHRAAESRMILVPGV